MDAQYVLEMRNISKEYGANMVLQDVSIAIRPGEIHALLGENGAGKSTLMNILFGMPVIHSTGGYKGEVLLDGKPTHITSPNDAMQLGIGMVHQEFMLIPGFTITENIKLNREITKPNVLSRVLGKNLEVMDTEAMRADARAALDSVGMGIDEYAPVKGLPVGHKQFVEIAREIDKKGMKLMVFDEPTAVLTESEAAQLLKVMRHIADQGIAIIFITHRLDEVMTAADNITVLRDGKLVTTVKTSETNLKELAELMIGRSNEEELAERPPREQPLDDADLVLKVDHLAVRMPGERVRDVSFTVRKGEIFGIGGLAGQGKVGIPNGIMGLYPSAGAVEFLGEPVPLNDVAGELDRGFAMVSEDRRGVGLLLDQSIEDNIASSAMQVHSRFLLNLLPRLKTFRLPKWTVILAALVCVLSFAAGINGLMQYQSVYNRAVKVRGYYTQQKEISRRVAGNIAKEEEALLEGAEGGAEVDTGGDEVDVPDDTAAMDEDEVEIVEVKPESGFLSEKPRESLTDEERRSVFFAEMVPVFMSVGVVLFLLLLAYYLMTDGSITQKKTSEIREYSGRMIKELDIRCTSCSQMVGTLSGGNQQKVCIARALALNPKFLFVSEPTRGIDIGAKQLVLETLTRLNREQGLTIVMVSSELLELRSICDRIAIVADGRVVETFPPDAPDVDIGLAMSGIHPAEGGVAV